jgi:tRNA A-37 threonylcarbamoyl transferase component Bud32
LPCLSSKRLLLAQQLVGVIAKHHRHGLMQTDLYLKNFIQQGDVIYTLDGDGIKPLPKHNEDQSALRNLAALLTKFDVLEIEKWLLQLLKAYGDARGWHTLPRLALLQHLIAVHRREVTDAYANKKVFRTCTDVQVNRSQGQFLAVASAYRNVLNVQNISVFDQHLQVPAFKSGNTSTVGLLTTPFGTKDAQKVVIKRYNVKSLWHCVMRSFRKTRAAASWANAHRLRLLGVPAIQPVSLLEQRYFFNLLRGKSYFLSEYIEAPTVDFVFAAEADKAKRAELVKQLVEMFYRLYLLQISHGDMKASNIMIVDEKPLLIDLDSMQQHRFGLIAKHQHARDLRRFMRNWQHDEALTNAFKKVFKVVYADHQPLKLAHIH